VVSYFGPIRAETKPANITTVLPSMFRDVDFSLGKRKTRYLYNQNVHIEHGVLRFSNEQGCEVPNVE
jgi:hypothetical protein